MSRSIVVSNRVAIGEDTRPSACGLAVGVIDALKETGGVWFGWNGEKTNLARLRENDLSKWRDTFLADLRSVATAASVTRRAAMRRAQADAFGCGAAIRSMLTTAAAAANAAAT
ncbi:hypothetical protein [Burkholderia sp. PU8-34]